MIETQEMRKWLVDFVGKEEDANHFSEVMINNKCFRNFAQASCHNSLSNEWFGKIISGSDDFNFNILCQQINQQLLNFLIETARSAIILLEGNYYVADLHSGWTNF